MSTRTGPGPPGRGHVERLADRAGDVLGLGDQEVVLGDRDRDAGDVGLLEAVGADHGRRHLAGDGHQRHRVHVGVRDRRDQVGGTRPAGRHAHADAARGLRVAGGGVAGALLVPDQDVPDQLGVQQRVIGRQDGAARDAEHHVRADPLERVDQGLRPGGPDPGRAAAGVRPRLGLRVLGGPVLGGSVLVLPGLGRPVLGRPVLVGPAGGLRGFGMGAFGGTRGVTVRRASGQVPRAGHGGGWRRRLVRAARWAVRTAGARAAGHLLGHRLISLAWKGGGIKNPLVPVGSRGEHAVSCLVSWLRADQVRGSA